MPTSIVIPHLGESVESATLVAWHKRVGDVVRRGDEIADVETDKAVMPLEAPGSGVLLAVLVAAGEEVSIGQLIAVIGREGETCEPKSSLAAAPAAPPIDPTPTSASTTSPRQKVSPLARRMAREHGVDLERVPSSDSEKISSREITRYLATQAPTASPILPVHGPHQAVMPDAPNRGRRVALSNVRRIVARRMLESTQTIPQFSVSANADASALLAFRDELANSESPVTITALLLALTAAALKHHPHLNARYDDDALIVYDDVHLGVAVASEDGLRVPVAQGVDVLTLHQIQQTLMTLAEKARAGRLTPDEISGATFTVSNLGMFGTAHFTPLVNPPQVAILGVGAAQPVFVPDGTGQPLLIQQMTLTVTADHRALDGADAARFLMTVKQLIEGCKPYFLRRL